MFHNLKVSYLIFIPTFFTMEMWKAVALVSLVSVYLLIDRVWKKRRMVQAERFKLPTVLLLFSFVLKLGIPLPRAIRFLRNVAGGGLLYEVTGHMIHYIYRGYELSRTLERLEGTKKEICEMIIQVYHMSSTEHPFTILRVVGKGHKKGLIEKVEGLESRKSISKAAAFFLPLFLSSIVSPHFSFSDVAFTLIAAFLVYKSLQILIGW